MSHSQEFAYAKYVDLMMSNLSHTALNIYFKSSFMLKRSPANLFKVVCSKTENVYKIRR